MRVYHRWMQNKRRGVEPRLAALRLLGQVRNSRLPSLPFGRLFCSPGFHIAFACGEQFRILKGRSKPLERALLSLPDDSFASFRLRRQPTGLIFGSFPTGGASAPSVRSMVVQVPWSGTCPPFRANKLRSLPAAQDSSASSIVATPLPGLLPVLH